MMIKDIRCCSNYFLYVSQWFLPSMLLIHALLLYNTNRYTDLLFWEPIISIYIIAHTTTLACPQLLWWYFNETLCMVCPFIFTQIRIIIAHQYIVLIHSYCIIAIPTYLLFWMTIISAGFSLRNSNNMSWNTMMMLMTGVSKAMLQLFSKCQRIIFYHHNCVDT